MEEVEKIKEEFYKFFENGYEFEFFLKEFLKDLGFSDIKVTQKSRDGGIDLICYKDILSGIDAVDSEKFIVQAKKYHKTVPPTEVRALNGIYKGIRKLFITTSDFSKNLRKEVIEQQMEVTLISGKDIVNYYIKNKSDKIFDWTPQFSKEKLENVIKKNKEEGSKLPEIVEIEHEKILRIISKNDIRARILRIPKEIFEEIKNQKFYSVVIDGVHKKLNIISDIKSFAGITEFYRNHNYITEETSDKNSYWYLDKNKQIIYIELE